jgi:hypothetical protein
VSLPVGRIKAILIAYEVDSVSGFDEAWTAIAVPRAGEAVSPGLRPLLHAVYFHVLSEPLSEAEFKKSLEGLLEFLAGDGRTNANCWAVDLFFALSQGWEQDWGERRLPDDFHDVLARMGEALHDTVKHPEVARNFGCLPEQLLERVKILPVG